ncbi:hypothetical protein K438DRAFT_1991380 [Mycena galopus ATCC 62051]|nr:hypothetical protein K438DRAFT_1991380 [Mycena galopus ATCC 62051]
MESATPQPEYNYYSYSVHTVMLVCCSRNPPHLRNIAAAYPSFSPHGAILRTILRTQYRSQYPGPVSSALIHMQRTDPQTYCAHNIAANTRDPDLPPSSTCDARILKPTSFFPPSQCARKTVPVTAGTQLAGARCTLIFPLLFPAPVTVATAADWAALEVPAWGDGSWRRAIDDGTVGTGGDWSTNWDAYGAWE